MQLKEKFEKRASLHAQMTRIVDGARANGRNLNADENRKFDQLDAEIIALTEDITRMEKLDRHSAALNQLQDINLEDINVVAGSRRSQKVKDAYARTFDKWMRAGTTHMSSEEPQILQRGTIDPQAALSPATGGSGGYLIPTGFSDELEVARKWFGGMVDVAETITTGSGNPMPWPTANDTTNLGEIIGPNTQVSQAYPGFNQVVFNAYKFSSKMLLIPIELLQDSFFDLDTKVPGRLGERIARIENQKFTVGTGVNEPTGLVTAAAAAGLVVQLPAGNTASVNSDNLITLEMSVDRAYRQGAKYMFSDQTLALLKKLKDNNGRSLWLPGLASSLQGGYPNTINGYEYVINNDMPNPGAGNYFMAFGMLSAFKIRRVNGYIAMRLTERYADYLQVGFLCAERADSNLVDAGTHPIALLQNSAT